MSQVAGTLSIRLANPYEVGGMDPRAALAEAVKRIRRLVDVAAGPAQRESARVMSEAASARAARAASRATLDAAAARARRLGWLPVVGARARAVADDALRADRTAAQAWTDLRARAETAQDVLAGARKARGAAARAASRLQRGDPLPPRLADRSAQMLARIRFLEQTDAREAGRGGALAPKTFALAAQMAALIDDWDAAPRDGAAHRAVPAVAPAPDPAPAGNRPVEVRRGKAQLALDFAGTGQVEAEPRIWLPVSASRTREMTGRGARIDREAPRRGSQMWVPMSERKKLDAFLPLAFRSQHTAFAFPPIRHNAAGHNLYSVFDRESWNHIRTTVYDRAGHRCAICGKQGGSLWGRLATPEERKVGGVVDAHEIWEWKIADEMAGTGIQILKRILCVCKDCHACFHEGRTMWKAREAGMEEKAAEYLKALRMAINRCDGATLAAQIELDQVEWEANRRAVSTWVLDLSHLATQDYMADHTLVLPEDNKAGLTPAHVGGIAFRTGDGTVFAAQDARALAEGQPPRPLTRPGGVR